MVMLHIKFKAMKRKGKCKLEANNSVQANILPLHTPWVLGCSQKVKTISFLKVVLLHDYQIKGNDM